MISGEWNDENWTELIYAINDGECILMLGPHVAVEEVDGQFCPLTEILAAELAAKIDPQDLESWKIDRSSLVQVAQYFDIKKKRRALTSLVRSFYSNRGNQPGQLHNDLAALPFYLTITSTLDNMFYHAVKENKDPTLWGYNFRRKDQDIEEQALDLGERYGTVEKPIIFYLYGTTKESDSLVLSENDFLDFLVAVILKNPLPKYILRELRDPRKSLLFLGFDFRKWYLRILLHILEVTSKENRSFALEQFSNNLDEFQRTVLFYSESDYNIQICNRELQGFVKELREKFEKEFSSPGGPTISSKDQSQNIPLNAPNVFLCHVKEDSAYAEDLRNHLKGSFRVWLSEDVSHEEKREQRFEETIKKLDYFVVLQSQTMKAKSERSFDERRMQQQKNELQQKWELLSQKLTNLEKERILQTQPDEKFRLENLITETRDERQQTEQQLVNLETQIPKGNDKQGQETFKREIQLALERQEDFPPGIRFIIPVKIEDCPVLEELKELEISPIDVTDDENMKGLIRTIKRDQQRRRNK